MVFQLKTVEIVRRPGVFFYSPPAEAGGNEKRGAIFQVFF